MIVGATRRPKRLSGGSDYAGTAQSLFPTIGLTTSSRSSSASAPTEARKASKTFWGDVEHISGFSLSKDPAGVSLAPTTILAILLGGVIGHKMTGSRSHGGSLKGVVVGSVLAVTAMVVGRASGYLNF